MFGWGKKVNKDLRYRIYLTDVAMYRNLVSSSSTIDTHWIYIFEDTAEQLRRLVEASGLSSTVQILSIQEFEERFLDADQTSAKGIWILCDIPPLSQMLGRGIAEALRLQVDINCIASMEDPFFRIFGGDRMIKVMQNLGMEENEEIEHKMINDSISRAQTKLSAKVLSEVKVRSSMQRWMEVNDIEPNDL